MRKDIDFKGADRKSDFLLIYILWLCCRVASRAVAFGLCRCLPVFLCLYPIAMSVSTFIPMSMISCLMAVSMSIPICLCLGPNLSMYIFIF